MPNQHLLRFPAVELMIWLASSPATARGSIFGYFTCNLYCFWPGPQIFLQIEDLFLGFGRFTYKASAFCFAAEAAGEVLLLFLPYMELLSPFWQPESNKTAPPRATVGTPCRTSPHSNRPARR